MKKLAALLLFVGASVFATTPIPESGELSSTNASYDGNSLLLTGHVVLDHGLGKMTAEEASLQKQDEAAKDFPFAMIQLRKDVLLSLKSSAELRCESADLDFSLLKGHLTAKENEKVSYSDQIKRKKTNDVTSLQMISEKIELGFSKQEYDGKKAEYEIDTILAKNAVEITYDKTFLLSADHALYRKQLPSDNKAVSKEFQGIITAYPKDVKSQCHLTHEGDMIDADSIDIDLLNSKMSMLHPKGTLISSLVPQGSNGKMHFQCDHLTWDNIKNSLLLKGKVEIEDESLGTVRSDDAIELQHVLVKGKHLIQSIHSKGYTELFYQEKDNVQRHNIQCYGNVHFDREKLQGILDSPTTSDGKVIAKQQIYYEENEIAFFADKASLEYTVSDNLLQPTSMTLKGNIRLFSHDHQKPLRCGVADRVNYSLSTQTLILSANPGKKVLFRDDTQGLSISAREVHITQDPETKEQSVKGVGNVQFALNTEELALLKQIFPKLPENHE